MAGSTEYSVPTLPPLPTVNERLEPSGKVEDTKKSKNEPGPGASRLTVGKLLSQKLWVSGA